MMLGVTNAHVHPIAAIPRHAKAIIKPINGYAWRAVVKRKAGTNAT